MDLADGPKMIGTRRGGRGPLEDRADSDLLDAARGGDGAAFAQLWSRHKDAAIRLAGGVTRTFDADDLVAEAYLKIFLALQAGKGPTGPFRPYLFVTVRNLAVSWSRRKREDELGEHEDIPDPRATDASVLAELDSALMLQAFRKLPSRWQEVLWFTEVDGLQPAAVAERMGVKANAVAALAYRAREGLRQAWIQAHINSTATGSEHRWVLEHVGQHARGALTGRKQTRFRAHLEQCPNCAVITAEAVEASRSFTNALLPVAVGIVGIATLSQALVPPLSASAAEPDGFPRDETNVGGSHPRGRPASVARKRRVALAALGAVVLVAAGASAYAARDEGRVHEADAAPLSATMTPKDVDVEASGTSPSATAEAPDGTPPAPEREVSSEPRPNTDPTNQASPPVLPPVPSSPSTSAPEVQPTAPVITSVDTGDGRYFPIVSGTARAGAKVTVRGGTASTTVTAGSDGLWEADELAVTTGTTAIDATSDGLTASSTMPALRSPVISLSNADGTAAISIQGREGTTYEIRWDGAPVASITTDKTGAGATTVAVSTAGRHTAAALARTPVRNGPIVTISSS